MKNLLLLLIILTGCTYLIIPPESRVIVQEKVTVIQPTPPKKTVPEQIKPESKPKQLLPQPPKG